MKISEINVERSGHNLYNSVDLVSHSFISKQDLQNTWPLCLTKNLIILCTLCYFWWGKHSLSRVSCLSYWQFSKFQLLNFPTKIWPSPPPSHLNFHIYPNIWSVNPAISSLFCISTSFRVRKHPKAGLNTLFGRFIPFLLIFRCFLWIFTWKHLKKLKKSFFSYFKHFFWFQLHITENHLKWTKKVENGHKKCFNQHLGTGGTQKLVQIYKTSLNF